MDVEKLYLILFVSALVILGIFMILAIIKSILGPTTADRVVSVNMISTMTVMALCVLTVLFTNEGYLADISMLYVLISFVAIVVLGNVFINANMRKKFKNMHKEDK